MSEPCHDFEVLISGYLDGELATEEKRVLEEHMDTCAACRCEFDSLQSLVIGTARALRVDEPPEAVWDEFLDSLYNRMERRSGWLLVILGSLALIVYGIFLYFTEPWGSALEKMLVAIPSVGLVLLFVSVLRQRLRASKTDRYSREVQR